MADRGDRGDRGDRADRRERPVFVDATVFLGMHHHDDGIRVQSLEFFGGHYTRRIWMNYEQVGICDAVIWRQPRAIQDLYYPFMDRLHSEMPIVREGYHPEELDLALGHPDLRGLRAEQALLAAQVLARDGWLVTHDPALARAACVRTRLWDFAVRWPTAVFPAELQALYETSRAFIHTPGHTPGHAPGHVPGHAPGDSSCCDTVSSSR